MLVDRSMNYKRTAEIAHLHTHSANASILMYIHVREESMFNWRHDTDQRTEKIGWAARDKCIVNSLCWRCCIKAHIQIHSYMHTTYTWTIYILLRATPAYSEPCGVMTLRGASCGESPAVGICGQFTVDERTGKPRCGITSRSNLAPASYMS